MSFQQLAGQLQASLATTNARAVGASSLTAAELRLLPLLSTHLSYQEIGERLYISKNTVKTQAYSAYRKLGVSSRSEAVIRARELGLDALTPSIRNGLSVSLDLAGIWFRFRAGGVSPGSRLRTSQAWRAVRSALPGP